MNISANTQVPTQMVPFLRERTYCKSSQRLKDHALDFQSMPSIDKTRFYLLTSKFCYPYHIAVKIRHPLYVWLSDV